MNRRRFLSFVSVAPVVAGTAAIAAVGAYRRYAAATGVTIDIDHRGADKASVERVERILRQHSRQLAETGRKTGVNTRV